MTSQDREGTARAYIVPNFDDLPHMRALLGLAINDSSQDGNVIAHLRSQYENDRAHHSEQRSLQRLHRAITKFQKKRG